MFLELLETLDLMEYFEGYGCDEAGFSAYIPVNDAFDGLDIGNMPMEELEVLVMNHFAQGQVYPKEQTRTTLAGKDLVVANYTETYEISCKNGDTEYTTEPYTNQTCSGTEPDYVLFFAYDVVIGSDNVVANIVPYTGDGYSGREFSILTNNGHVTPIDSVLVPSMDGSEGKKGKKAKKAKKAIHVQSEGKKGKKAKKAKKAKAVKGDGKKGSAAAKLCK